MRSFSNQTIHQYKNTNDKFENTKALNKPNNFMRKNIKLCIEEAYFLSNLAKKEIRTVEKQTKNFADLYQNIKTLNYMKPKLRICSMNRNGSSFELKKFKLNKEIGHHSSNFPFESVFTSYQKKYKYYKPKYNTSQNSFEDKKHQIALPIIEFYNKIKNSYSKKDIQKTYLYRHTSDLLQNKKYLSTINKNKSLGIENNQTINHNKINVCINKDVFEKENIRKMFRQFDLKRKIKNEVVLTSLLESL